MRTAASTCVSRSEVGSAPGAVQTLRGGAGGLGGLLGCALISACTASAEDVRPPQDQLLFPSGMIVSPDRSVLFVANANSELRYDSGSIGVIELATVGALLDRWIPIPHVECTGPTVPRPSYCVPDPGSCTQDPDHRETLGCDDAAQFFRPKAGVRIGNFATDIALQDFGQKLRVIVPTRGDPSIAWADFDGTRLSCTTGSTDFALCDDAHRLVNVQNDPNLTAIPNEPFGVFAEATPGGASNASGFAVVTHLTSGGVTLIDSPADGDARIADVQVNLFATDATTGISSATGVAGRLPGPDGDIVYVGSRTDVKIRTFTVGRPVNSAPPYLLPSNVFFLGSVGNNTNGGSSDTRSLKFSPSGKRMYVVNRLPPSLQIFDTSIGPTGLPRNVGVGGSDICRQASTAFVFGDDPITGDDTQERAYVSCFQDGQIYVIDPHGTSQVEDIITVGRGPYSIAGATYLAKDQKDPSMTMSRSLLFVSNFLEDTIAVVDVTPASATRNRVVLRIGKPKPLEAQ